MELENVGCRASILARAGALVFLTALALALAGGCDGGREGERCNPALSHDECGVGLSCQQPGACAENYCCPAAAATSTNPYCNGAGCPPASAVDGGGDAGGGGDAAGGG